MCPQCLPPELQPKKGYMSFELFEKIIDEAEPFVYNIQLFLGGESLLHKDITRMIEYAKSRNLKVMLHSNATILTPDKSKDLIESGLDVVSFSFDGYDKETYERSRVNANFEDTLKNIVNFLRLKKELKAKKPYTIIQSLETAKSKQCKDNQSKERFLAYFGSLPLDEHHIVRAHDWAGTIFQIGERPKNAVYNACRFIWFAMAIAWDGTVVPCCDDLLYKYKIGNLKDTELLSLWNNKKMIFLRKTLAESRYQEIELCARCKKLWIPKNSLQQMIPYGDITSYIVFGDKIVGKLRKILTHGRFVYYG
jgi:radical SAM protein with 4Fe4S-binding SPASM domain